MLQACMMASLNLLKVLIRIILKKSLDAKMWENQPFSKL